MKEFVLKELPPIINTETIPILKKTIAAHRSLAELKGMAQSIPNQGILINTLALQEAKDSSAIENIITTHDELFKNELFTDYISNAATKEVQNYVGALKCGFELIKKQNLITINNILEIQEKLELNQAGFRKLPGTELKNDSTGETVYIPPQHHADIVRLMTNLEAFINDDSIADMDPLIKMAIIHYQFESIHPFYDGNGRAGRILNILYLVVKGLLNIPSLYLSRYIIEHKAEYYNLLQDVRDHNSWEQWILYILTGIEETSRYTITLIEQIREYMMYYKHELRNKFKFYSQDLLNNLFYHPYTKIEFLVKDINVSRITAAKYLDSLAEAKLLHKERFGRSNYYINIALFNILTGNTE